MQAGRSSVSQPLSTTGEVVPLEQAGEIPLPRILVPGLGTYPMPVSEHSHSGVPLREAGPSYNASEVLGDRSAEMERLRVQLNLSFHKVMLSWS